MFAMPDMKLFYNGFSYLPASRGKSKLPLKFDLTLARNCTRRCRRQLHPWPAVSSPQPIDLHRITPCPYLFLVYPSKSATQSRRLFLSRKCVKSRDLHDIISPNSEKRRGEKPPKFPLGVALEGIPLWSALLCCALCYVFITCLVYWIAPLGGGGGGGRREGGSCGVDGVVKREPKTCIKWITK